MKNIMESSKVFTAYAIIDYCYYEIKQLYENSTKRLSPLEIAVQNACGYNPETENAKKIIKLAKEIIKNKKIIEADYSGDQQLIDDLAPLIPKNAKKIKKS